MVWTINARPLAEGEDGPAAYRSAMAREQLQRAAERSTHGHQPNTTGWLGRWRLGAHKHNDYLIDREAQKTESYSGIPTIFLQDQAMTESMGGVYTRQREHLGTTDLMIIRTRSRLIQAAKALRDAGTTPPGVDNPGVYRTRTGWTVLPNSADWLEGTKDLRKVPALR
jgi:hypothetical protein